MIKRIMDKINPRTLSFSSVIIMIAIFALAIVHFISEILAIIIMIVITLLTCCILNIKSYFEKHKREKAEDNAYIALKNKTIQEIAELTNLDAGEAAAYSKLQEMTLFDLSRIAKRAENK